MIQMTCPVGRGMDIADPGGASNPPNRQTKGLWKQSMKTPSAPAHQKTDEDYYRIAAEALLNRRILCSDCPPIGYPTDCTRCEEYPRRGGAA